MPVVFDRLAARLVITVRVALVHRKTPRVDHHLALGLSERHTAMRTAIQALGLRNIRRGTFRPAQMLGQRPVELPAMRTRPLKNLAAALG